MNKIQNEKKHRIILYGVLWSLFVIYLVFIFCVNTQHFNYKMNSDIGAEAVLGRLIWDSGEIIPDSWISSTETRIIATPQVAALFYGMTGDMNLSLGLACCVMTVGIMLAIWTFMRTTGSRRSSCLGMCLLSLSLAGNMTILELLYLFASYYGIHVIAFFLTMNCYPMLLQYSENNSHKRSNYENPNDVTDGTVRTKIKPACKLIVSLVLAFLLGMQGTRGILITYGPLFGIEVIRQAYCLLKRKNTVISDLSDPEQKSSEKCSEKYSWKAGIQPFLWASVLLIASYLGTKMPFATGQEISRNIRNGFSKLFQTVLPDTWKAIGFTEGHLFQNICLGILVLCVLWQVLRLLIKMVRRQNLHNMEWCFLVTAASPVVAAVMVAFTTVESSERYYFMWIFAMAFAVILGWEQTGRELKNFNVNEDQKSGIAGNEINHVNKNDPHRLHRNVKWYLTCIWNVIPFMVSVIVVIGNLNHVYVPILKAQEPTPSDALEVVRYLEEHGYEEAYSTFESANMMTALSDGRVNVYALNSFDSMDMCQWLTSRDWYPEDGVADQSGTVYVVPDARSEELDRLTEKGMDYEILNEVGTYWIVRLR